MLMPLYRDEAMLTDFEFHTGNLPCTGLMGQPCIRSMGFSPAILAVVLACPLTNRAVCTVVRWFLSGLQACFMLTAGF